MKNFSYFTLFYLFWTLCKYIAYIIWLQDFSSHLSVPICFWIWFWSVALPLPSPPPIGWHLWVRERACFMRPGKHMSRPYGLILRWPVLMLCVCVCVGTCDGYYAHACIGPGRCESLSREWVWGRTARARPRSISICNKTVDRVRARARTRRSILSAPTLWASVSPG